MRWADLPTNPSIGTLRQFAGVGLFFFGGLAYWLWPERPGPAWLCLGLSVGIGGVGLLWPRLVKPVFVGWLILFFPVGWAISQLLLALLLYLVFTPLGLFFRLIGRDPLERRFQPDSRSYWTPKTGASDVRRYFRPY